MAESAATLDQRGPSPILVVIGLTSLFFACTSAGSLVTLYLGWRQIEDAMLGWFVLGIFFGIPFVGFLGATAIEADRRRGLPLRGGWWLVAFGLAMMAHWIPVAVWPLVLMGAAVVEPHRFEQHGIDALWSTTALLGVLLGMFGIWIGRRSLDRRVRRVVPTGDPQEGVASSVWAGAAIACGSAVLSMVWIVFMAEDGWDAGGLWWLVTWVLAVGALAATFGSWLASFGSSSAAALRAVGAAVVGQALVPFLFALAPAMSREPELRYAYLAITVVLATAGTFVWGWWRPEGRTAVD